jgi:putative transcriptional regulator
MSKLGQRLVESAREALAIAEGKAKPARTVQVEDVDVAAIRSRMKLSQARFADRFHLSAATVRDWEQRRRTPDRIAANFLRVIAHAPEMVDAALQAPPADKPAKRTAKV